MREIFEPVEMGGLKLKNCLVRSATWAGIVAPGGGIDERAYGIYDELARGGVGLIVTGFTSVASNDRSFGGMMRLHDDALVERYARLAAEVDVPVVLVGGLRSREAMRRVLDETGVELLALSRPLLFDPDFPAKLERGACDHSDCVSCIACYSTPEHRCRFRG